MNHQVKLKRNGRIADYFVVVGPQNDNISIDINSSASGDEADSSSSIIRDPQNYDSFQNGSLKSIDDLKLMVDVIDYYPILFSQTEETPRLPEGIPLFCFPNGLRLRYIPRSTSKRGLSPIFHSFVNTFEDGSHVLGCCLTFYEQINQLQYEQLLNITLSIMSNSSDSTSNIDNGNNRHKSNSTNKPHPFSVPPMEEIYVPKCLCIFSSWLFVTSFKKFLVSLYKVSISPSIIPIERFICNIIDDVPAPPPGRVDINFYFKDEVLTFRCPATNEPNVWSGLPLFPLFECLSPENICYLLALVLTERQITFISSQFSLLTSCAEAITSLIYPFTWSHAYIPILPAQLLGMLGAPFPFIVGLHTSIYSTPECCIFDDAVRIFLDENRIVFGKGGQPPALPDRNHKKLLSHINSVAPLFLHRSSFNMIGVKYGYSLDYWISHRLPHFDDAYSQVSDKSIMYDNIKKYEEILNNIPRNNRNKITVDLAVSDLHGSMYNRTEPADSGLNENELRAGFLKFFVAIMKNYKKYLIYGNPDNPDPLVKFKFQEFLSEHSSDWQPFIREMIGTQSFTQFVDERVLLFKQDQDVVFFDESIDAKLNRYTFKTVVIDTPFLKDKTNKHIKTYVPPTPDLSDLPPDFTYTYPRFPRLNELLFSKPRKLNATFNNAQRSSNNLSAIRLKRKNTSSSSAMANTNQTNLSAVSCIYTSYMVTLCQFITSSMNKAKVTITRPQSINISTEQIIGEYINGSPAGGGNNGSIMETIERRRSNSSYVNSFNKYDINSQSPEIIIHNNNSNNNNNKNSDNGSIFRSPAAPNSKIKDSIIFDRKSDNSAIISSSKLALKVAFEALHCLSKLDQTPDEIVYRALADACGACGESAGIIDLLIYMDEEGLQPDQQMLHAVARAFASDETHATNVHSRKSFEENSERNSFANQQTIGKVDSNGSTSVRSASGKFISPAEVWTVTDWKDFHKKHFPSNNNGSLNPHQKLLPTRKEAVMASQLQQQQQQQQQRISNTNNNNGSIAKLNSGNEADSTRLSIKSNVPTQHSSSSSSSKKSSQFDRWSSDSREGNVPSVSWNFAAEVQSTSYYASRKLSRHMAICEQKLVSLFPNLFINLNDPNGMTCPNKNCSLAQKRCLTIGEINRGWHAGDTHRYTTQCIQCGFEFIPRFTVTASSTIDDVWIGSDGPNTPLWCELLSPWTLKKEIMTVLFQDGVEVITENNFRLSSSQRGVVFWNAIIAFRLRGLPFTFLLSSNAIEDAFPPNSTSNNSNIIISNKNDNLKDLKSSNIIPTQSIAPPLPPKPNKSKIQSNSIIPDGLN
eukprot:gene4270-6049_t